MTAVASMLLYTGLAAFAFAMPRHHRTVFGSDAPVGRRLLWRLCGWTLTAASVAVAISALGWEMGVVFWFAIVPAAGLALSFLLAYRPRWWPAPVIGLLVLGLAI